MTPPTEVSDDPPAADPRSPLVGTLPLIMLTGALFVGSYLTYLEYSRLGPDNFPLWGLLMTLGFVAAIGSVVSWFFATDQPPAASRATGREPAPATVSPQGSRTEWGRPVPDGAAARGGGGAGVEAAPTGAGGATPPPWDEDVLPPVTARGPRPVLTTPDDPGEIGRALAEIAEIQRQLSARRPPAGTKGEAPTRA